jgi:hypothetical protein
MEASSCKGYPVEKNIATTAKKEFFFSQQQRAFFMLSLMLKRGVVVGTHNE